MPDCISSTSPLLAQAMMRQTSSDSISSSHMRSLAAASQWAMSHVPGLRRIATAEEIAAFALTLASDEHPYLTGAALVIDHHRAPLRLNGEQACAGRLGPIGGARLRRQGNSGQHPYPRHDRYDANAARFHRFRAKAFCSGASRRSGDSDAEFTIAMIINHADNSGTPIARRLHRLEELNAPS
jgi:hypothetical protein